MASFTCPQCTKSALLLLSVHFARPIHTQSSSAAVALSTPCILQCPAVWASPFHKSLPPSYPLIHPNFPLFFFQHSFCFSRGLSLPSISSSCHFVHCRAVDVSSQCCNALSCSALCVSVCHCTHLRELKCHGQL